MPLNSLLEDLDKAVVNWLDASCSLVDQDGNNITPYYSAKPRWAYQYDVNTNSVMDYNRRINLPVVAVRRTGIQFVQERYIHPAAKLKLQYQVEPNNPDPRAMSVFWVPAPVPVDVEYEISILSNHITEQNSLVEGIIGAFSTGEIYLNVNGFVQHMKFEGYNDDSAAYLLDDERLFSGAITTRVRGRLVDVSNNAVEGQNIISIDIEVSNTKGAMSVDEAYAAWLYSLTGEDEEPIDFGEP